MINRTELDELREALNSNKVLELIERWEAKHIERELAKESNITFKVFNHKKEPKDVIARKYTDELAYHKDVWGGKNWHLSHVKTGASILSGSKTNVLNTMKELKDWNHLDVLLRALEQHGMKALRYVSQSVSDEYRQLYNKAKGH